MQRLLEYLQNHPVLASVAMLLALAVLFYELRMQKQNVSGVLPQEAIRLMNQGATLFDLRDAEAFAQGHISGAKRLTADQVDNAAEQLKKYREKVVLLCCESGASASTAVRKLHAAGFTKAFNLRGGIAAWRAESLPLVRA
jgi:rhodanese-related sulfurtransferase